MLKRLLLLVALATLSSSVFSQQIIYDIDYDVRFDNQEYSGIGIAPSQTLFGNVLSGTIGLSFEEHSLHFGGVYKREFGSYRNDYHIDQIFYYSFNDHNTTLNAGVIPFEVVQGNYISAIFGSDHYYNTQLIQGFHLAKANHIMRAELIFDWLGKVSSYEPEVRERFRITSSMEFDPAFLVFGYNFNMLHLAASKEVGGVVDNILIYPYIGIDFAKYTSDVDLEFRIGWLSSYQNNRIDGNGYVNPRGVIYDFKVEYYGLGLKNTLFIGDNIMPFYDFEDANGDIYGSLLYSGERFFATESGMYNRFEMYWNVFNRGVVDFSLSMVFHRDGHGNMGWQQKATLKVDINNNMITRLFEKN